jgi:hypothetical protein
MHKQIKIFPNKSSAENMTGLTSIYRHFFDYFELSEEISQKKTSLIHKRLKMIELY